VFEEREKPNAAILTVMQAWREALDGSKAVEHTRILTGFNRAVGSSGYHAAIQYVYDELTKVGLSSVRVLTYPCDAKASYYGWRPRAAWNVKMAELWLKEPMRAKLVDYDETPIGLYFGSCGTPPGGVELELVDVGRGTSDADYAEKEVRGRAILASGVPRAVYERAIKERGAVGIISDHMPWPFPEIGRTSVDLPDLVSYGTIDIPPEECPAGGFIFSISSRLAGRLRDLLATGPAKVWTVIDGGPFAGAMEVVTGSLSGRLHPEKEVIVIAHLCHPSPGANDNASGVALALEIARCFTALQGTGKFARPMYSVRFLFVPEMVGTIAYLHGHEKRLADMLCCINLDMVGANQRKIRSAFSLEQSPWSMPTYLNELAAALLAHGRPSFAGGAWRVQTVGFEGGSDSVVFNDSTIGVPAICFGYRSDLYYHSNMDVWTNMDQQVFANVGVAAGSAAWIAANMSAELACELACLVYTSALKRLFARVADLSINTQDISLRQRLFRICLGVEKDALSSITAGYPADEGLQAIVQRYQRWLDELGKRLVETLTRVDTPQPVTFPALARQVEAGALRDAWWQGIPFRVKKGPLPPPRAEKKDPPWWRALSGVLSDPIQGYDYRFVYKKAFEVMNLADGSRTMEKIYRFIEQEFERCELSEFKELIAALKRAQWLKVKRER